MFSSHKTRRLTLEEEKHGQLTVFDSFNKPVLSLLTERNVKPPERGRIDITKRGQSTIVANPPIFWFEHDASDYIQTAEDALSNHSKIRYIKSTYMPAPYPECPLKSEADVVRATALWILHPIIMTLQEMFGNVQCRSEDSRPGIRCDTLIAIDNKPVFVFEYKSRGYLVSQEYLDGRHDLPTARDSASLLSFKNEYQARVTSQKKVFDELRRKGNPTVFSCLGHNAACITKQAQAYSQGYETRYVACFDWDNLFLWNFAGNTWNRKGKGEVTFASETWAWGTLTSDRASFRKVLLGFILQAHYDCNRGDRRCMGPAPWDQTERDKRMEANSLAHQSNRRDAPSAAAGSATQRLSRDQQPQTPQRPRPPPSASSYAPSELQGSSRDRPSRPSDPRPPSSSGHVSAQRLSSDQRQSPDHRYAAGQRYPSDQRPPPNHGYSDQPGRGSQRLLTASDPRRGSSRDPSPSSSSSHARRDSSSHHRSADYPVYDRPHSRSRYPVDDPGYDYRPQQAAPYPPDDYGVPRYSDMPAPPSTSRSRQGPPSATSPQPKRSLQERQHGSSPYGPPPSSAGQSYPSGIADLLADSAEVVKEARQVPMKGVSQVLVVREDSLEKDAGRSPTNKRSRGFLGVW
ncbi:hypothetical protein MCOR19_001399 [Pyricularia oryzae]|nr:hypothetical protein MCOR19_001399 [Pyricularia oryzae]KAI6308095.1 hypothetical protein MCOR34_007339 [Pyricularia oryzae]KAI6490963.1 hypothetical protein MCOR18_002146 [Pyricularia oryzae]KAI6492596.1 hypothetical protein MCOR11_006569 [Pyricularia oryzae]